MTIEDSIKTAHIHFESATFRVHLPNIEELNFARLEETQPDFVLFIGKSHDHTQNKTSLLVEVVGEYDLVVMADWIKDNG